MQISKTGDWTTISNSSLYSLNALYSVKCIHFLLDGDWAKPIKLANDN